LAEVLGQQWFDALTRYVEGLQQETLRAAQNAVEFLHTQVQERAALDPDWSELADDITVWSQDGKLWIGINNLDLVSQAFALEYGDEVRPPNALFRTLTGEIHAASRNMSETMQNSGFAGDFRSAKVPGMD
jgi:hypothetical protein